MKKYTIILGIISIFFLTSCVKIDINQVITKEGTSHVNSIYDMSTMVQMQKAQEKKAGEYGSGINFTMSSSNSDSDPCERDNKNKYLLNAICTNETGGIIKIAGNVEVAKNGWLTTKDGIYIYDLLKIDVIMDSSKEEEKKGPSSSSDSLDPAAMGFRISYVLNMPGEIVYSDVGTISGSTLTMDYFDVIKLKTAYVVSKDTGIALTTDEAKGLVLKISGTKEIEKKITKREIKILTIKQQKQVQNAMAKVDYARLQKVITKIDANIAKIQAKKIKFTKERKNIQILEDIKTLIEESL